MKIIQVFEYEVLRVGATINNATFEAKHFEALVQLAPTPYFQVQHQSIRFSHYVGTIALDGWVLEILPKADMHNDYSYWKTFFISLLDYCKLLNFNADISKVGLQSHTITELYLVSFLTEIERLLRRGLAMEYTTIDHNQKALSGKLLIAQHLQRNLVHQERFYVRQRIKTFDTLPNQILFYALQLAQQLSNNSVLQTRLRFCLQSFLNCSQRKVTPNDFDKIQLNTTNAHYKTVLEYARQIIEQQSNDIFFGDFYGSIWMYDMNLLFEDYLFRQLQAACPSGVKVFRQQRQNFWQERFIRPDIIIQTPQQTIVLDTKWKILDRIHPTMSDIQQAFVYSHYFAAQKTVLVFPKVYPIQDLPPTPFQPTSDGKIYFCEVRFVEVVNQEGLNIELGKQLLEKLINATV